MVELHLTGTNKGLWEWLTWLNDHVGYYIGSNPLKGTWYGEGWQINTTSIPESYHYLNYEYTLTIANPEMATLFALRWDIK